MPKAKNEHTSKRIGTIASKAMRDPASLTLAEIRALGASATTQRPDRKTSKKTPKKKALKKTPPKAKPSKKKSKKKVSKRAKKKT
jgi:carnitine O-acetyltransferase